MQDSEFMSLLVKEIVKHRISDSKKVINLRDKLCKKYKPSIMPNLIQIFLASKGKDREYLFEVLKSKPSRSMSGVSVVAVMTKPIPCKHGKCLMCPGGLKSSFGDVPQSYTGNEPASRRAKRNDYHPYLQVFNRLEQYILLGIVPSKIELIIMGGTFPSFRKDYQDWFIKNCFKAFNDFGKMFLSEDGVKFDEFFEFFELDYRNEMGSEREERLKKKILKLVKECSLKKEQVKNEKGIVKCIALVIETRPDYCGDKEIKRMLEQGCTRVELGVQSLDNRVLRKIERGHSVEDSIEATYKLKEKFLKVGYHVMINLPGSSIGEDVMLGKMLFMDSNFRPDALKIYPCAVVKGTKLYKLWKDNKYRPWNVQELITIISEIKKIVPEYCRIMRIQRDIPENVISAGSMVTNLRQYLDVKCRCIRCREIRGGRVGKIKLVRRNYEASLGKEVFLSFESNDKLLGFLRLRKNKNGKVGIREIHVYGNVAKVGAKGEVQHRGLGKRLISEAEKIAAKEFNAKKIYVISGIGVKEYYKKLGYKKDGTYMSKKI